MGKKFKYFWGALVCCCCLCSYGQNVAYRPFKHYGDRVAQFDKERGIDSCSIVMLGNSLTEYAGNWGKLLGAEKVVNRGIAGDDATGIYNRLGQILPWHPEAIFLMVGINDLSHGLTPEAVVAQVRRLILRIRKDSPVTKIYVQSLLPINEAVGNWPRLEGKTDAVPEVNRLLKAYCDESGIEFIDLYHKFVRRGTNTLRNELTQDGLHLTRQGYKLWAFELRKYVR